MNNGHWQMENGQPKRRGHNDVSTTMIYLHVMEKAAMRVRSSLDGFEMDNA